MKALSIVIMVSFILLTLGAISVNLIFSDGTSCHYTGWIEAIKNKGE